MSGLRLPISIDMQRTPVASRWISERWEPVSVRIETAAPLGTSDSAPLSCDAITPAAVRTHAARAAVLMVDSASATRWRFGGHVLELHRSEGEGYYLNLTSPEPKVFVMWRMLEPEAQVRGGPEARPELATVSYNEAARMLDGGEQVDAVPLPAEIRAWMEPFVAEHYKPEPKRKVRRRDPLRDDKDTAASRRLRIDD